MGFCLHVLPCESFKERLLLQLEWLQNQMSFGHLGSDREDLENFRCHGEDYSFRRERLPRDHWKDAFTEMSVGDNLPKSEDMYTYDTLHAVTIVMSHPL